MKKQASKAQLEKLLSETWMKQLEEEMDPADTMNHLNRMALVTHDIAARLDAIITDLEKKKKTARKKRREGASSKT